MTIESTAARGENHRAFASFVEGRIRGLLEGTGVAGDKEASCAAPLKGTDGAAQGTTESADGGRGCQQRWSVCVRHIEFVKSYAPRIDHVVCHTLFLGIVHACACVYVCVSVCMCV